MSLHWSSLSNILIYIEISNNINGEHEIFMFVKKGNGLRKKWLRNTTPCYLPKSVFLVIRQEEYATCVPSAWLKHGSLRCLRCLSMDSKGICPNENMPLATCHFSISSTATRTECLNLPRGFSIFLTQHGSRQTSSGVSSILEASYNSNSRGFVDSIITHSQYYTAALSTFPSSTQKTNKTTIWLSAYFAFCLCYPIKRQLSPSTCAFTCFLWVNTVVTLFGTSSPEIHLTSCHTEPFHWYSNVKTGGIYMVQRYVQISTGLWIWPNENHRRQLLIF